MVEVKKKFSGRPCANFYLVPAKGKRANKNSERIPVYLGVLFKL